MVEMCQNHSGLRTDIDNIKKDSGRIEKKTDDMCRKLDNIRNWIMTLTGGIIVSLILLIIQMSNGAGV